VAFKGSFNGRIFLTKDRAQLLQKGYYATIKIQLKCFLASYDLKDYKHKSVSSPIIDLLLALHSVFDI
jgi:hypothetical protein